jgi:hypothetical protein
MVGTGRFELPTPRTPSDFRRIDADYCSLLNFTTVMSFRASFNRTELLLKYAIFYLESPQKSPQFRRLQHTQNALFRLDILIPWRSVRTFPLCRVSESLRNALVVLGTVDQTMRRVIG